MRPDEARRRRATAQGLAGDPWGTPDLVVQRLLAVQAQDLGSARLAVRARSARLTVSDVDRALADGALVVTWLMRGTLHLVRREDYPWLWALTAPTRLTANRRRLSQLGISPSEAVRAVEVMSAALADAGPLTRAELASRCSGEGLRTEGQAMPHLLMLAALQGILVQGPVRADGQAYVLTRDWLGDPPQPLAGDERDRALGELALRYLRAHGPAGERDLASWSGFPLRDVRAGLRGLGSSVVQVAGDLVDLARRDGPADVVPPRLLPAFDPYAVGWRDRSFAVPERYAHRVHPGGGLLRSTATVDGLAVGTWTMRRGRGGIAVEVTLFGSQADHTTTFTDEVADVQRFAG